MPVVLSKVPMAETPAGRPGDYEYRVPSMCLMRRVMSLDIVSASSVSWSVRKSCDGDSTCKSGLSHSLA